MISIQIGMKTHLRETSPVSRTIVKESAESTDAQIDHSLSADQNEFSFSQTFTRQQRQKAVQVYHYWKNWQRNLKRSIWTGFTYVHTIYKSVKNKIFENYSNMMRKKTKRCKNWELSRPRAEEKRHQQLEEEIHYCFENQIGTKTVGKR